MIDKKLPPKAVVLKLDESDCTLKRFLDILKEFKMNRTEITCLRHHNGEISLFFTHGKSAYGVSIGIKDDVVRLKNFWDDVL